MGAVYLIILIIILFAMKPLLDQDGKEATYDEFLAHLAAGHVDSVELGEEYYTGYMDIPARDAPPPAAAVDRGAGSKDGSTESGLPKLGGKLPRYGAFKFFVKAVKNDGLVQALEGAHQKFGTKYTGKTGEGFWTLLSLFGLPFLLIVLLWYLMMRQSGQMGRAALSFGKTRAKLYAEKVQSVTFNDVAGCEEAKEELKEVVDFLKSPKKYQTLGGRMPKGILLVGPPGTGKTLLARAVAGESKTPFFSLSGSDFVEMFVGVGAARVRDLFQQAKHRAPCIVFVDELDAVGRHRGAGLGGGHDEREQTLNQLLVEMDGFDTTQGVIFLAATNRPDVLDPALLRPGRFDRQVVIDAPDAKGRKAILEVHARSKAFAKGIDFGILAHATPGLTGADLANVINEAALLAARRSKKLITMPEVEEAVDRVMAGPERKSRVMDEREKRLIAFHEGGHAMVAHVLPNTDEVHKITVIPRGRALGYTLTLPEQDKFLMTREQLRDELAMLMGGRVAEEIVAGDVTTGAQNDIERATKVARQMVTEYGMSDAIGPRTLGQKQGEVFLGRDWGSTPDYSDAVALEIDSEVRFLIDEAHDVALEILTQNRDNLEQLAELLMEKETLDRDEVEAFFRRVPKWMPREPEVRSAGLAVSRKALRDQRPPSTPGTLS
jgi:cell division protease FtsH